MSPVVTSLPSSPYKPARSVVLGKHRASSPNDTVMKNADRIMIGLLSIELKGYCFAERSMRVWRLAVQDGNWDSEYQLKKSFAVEIGGLASSRRIRTRTPRPPRGSAGPPNVAIG